MTRVHACTIIARNYLPQARVLGESFRRQHPDGTLDVLLLDADRYPLAPGEPFGVVDLGELELDPVELRRMAMLYSVLELATALKPWLLRTLLRRHDHVVYLDPDIAVYRPLDGISELARERSLVLTPHLTAPMSRRDAEPTETAILYAGVFNLGFVAVGHDADDMLAWWADRLRRECIVAPREARFVDQRWMDLVLGHRERLHVLRDPDVNVAWWNLPTRQFDLDGGRYTVDGVPLTFFHFTGYDPRAPHLLSRHQGEHPKVLLSERPALRTICDEYGERLRAQGFDEAADLPYGYDALTAGTPVTASMRRLYRGALREAEARGTEEPPVPFDADTDHDFLEWLREPDEPGAPPRVSRYLRWVWAHRPDLRDAYPNLRWAHNAAYLEWVIGRGRDEEGIPYELVPEPDDLTRRRGGTPAGEGGDLDPGVNVVAGDGFEGVAEAVRAAGMAMAAVDSFADSAPFDTTVVCADGDALLTSRHDYGPQVFDGRRTIAVWRWQVPAVPERIGSALSSFDEVWVESEFVREAVAAATATTTHVMPVVVAPGRAAHDAVGSVGARHVGVLAFVDFLDAFERVNPLGAMHAYQDAFRPDSGAHLLVRTVNGHNALEQLELVRDATAGRPDVTVVDGALVAGERESLLAACDCFLSLHRSCSFGLPLAEAMALGRPVVATAYSGNLEYMTDENAYLVPHALVAAPEGGFWADPDVAVAAELLREARVDHEAALARGARAAEDMAARHSVERAARFVRARLKRRRGAGVGRRDRAPERVQRP